MRTLQGTPLPCEDGAQLPGGGLPAWLAGPGARLLADRRRTLAALALLLVASVGIRFAQTINHDVAWYFYTAQKLLEGGTLYRDIGFDVNPPLIVFLNLPAAYLAQVTGAFGVSVFLLYMFALILLCLAVSWRGLAALPGLSAPARRALVLAVFVTLAIVPAGIFGQREHLMVTLVTPYLVVILLRSRNGCCHRPLAGLAGALGALGFSLKPHFLVIPVALEVYLLWRHRNWRSLIRAETLALAATGLLYALTVVLFAADYLTRAAPYALEIYNGSYRATFSFVLQRLETILVPAALLLYPLLRSRLAFKEAADLFLIAASCFFAVYLVQMKGWNYHIYPTTAALFMFLASTLVGLLGAKTGGREPTAGPAPLAVAALTAALLVHPLLNPGTRAGLTQLFGPIVREHGSGSSIYFFSSDVNTAFPLVVYAGVEWSSRFPALWTLPGLQRWHLAVGAQVDQDSEPILGEIERYTIEAVIADFQKRPPALVFVDARAKKYWYDAPFDFIDYFSQEPRFVEIWAHYQKIDDVSGFHVYRRCPLPCLPGKLGQAPADS